VMMRGEKPGGHGERCVAVGTLDMALWDAAGKIAGLPLYRLLQKRLGNASGSASVDVYASGGYPYPHDDLRLLQDEIRALLDAGYTHFKIKIGAFELERDIKRVEAVLALLPSGAHLAVDAMNAYDAASAVRAAAALKPFHLRWFEDVCDPLDFETQSLVAAHYDSPIAAGEALFSAAEATLLDHFGGLRRDRDILLFDPAHCYGIPEYGRIVGVLTKAGWPLTAFWPHGGHLFTLHVATAFGLAGSEVNPRSFAPFGGIADDAIAAAGTVTLPESAGIGFERRNDLRRLFDSL
jgi:D(-)-tartrate dehydratase